MARLFAVMTLSARVQLRESLKPPSHLLVCPRGPSLYPFPLAYRSQREHPLALGVARSLLSSFRFDAHGHGPGWSERQRVKVILRQATKLISLLCLIVCDGNVMPVPRRAPPCESP